MNSIVKFGVFLCTIALLATSCKDNDLLQEDELQGGSLKSAAAVIDLGLPSGTDPVDSDGNVTVSRNLTLSAGNTYILHNYFRVQDGYTITIQAGVTIQGERQGASSDDLVPGTLVIERGASINAVGTSSSPIVFTSNQSSPAPGDWGGVVILGKADVDVSATGGTYPSGTNGLGFIEGLPTPNNTGRYGNGDNPSVPAGGYNADNSGTLRYVRIEYAGHIIGAVSVGNELNGLTLGGVGSGTTLQYIEVYMGQDDGYEFFGGTVNGDHLVSALVADDDFDTDQGYKGQLQFCVVVRMPDANYLADFPLNGCESNGDNDDDYLGDYTSGQFSNFTIVGPHQNDCSESVNANYAAGIFFRDSSRLDLCNSVILGFPQGVRKTCDAAFNANPCILSATMADVKSTTVVVPNVPGAMCSLDDCTGNAINGFLNSCTGNTNLDNDCLTATTCTEASPLDMASRAGLPNGAWDGINGTMPDLRPLSGSSLLNSADFSLLSGFDVVTYRGAFGSSSNWMSTWTIW